MDKANPDATASLRAWGFNTFKQRDGHQIPMGQLQKFLASFRGRPVPYGALQAWLSRFSYLPEEGKADVLRMAVASLFSLK